MDEPALPTRRTVLRLWLRIGLLSFGGPAAQIALMHRELVERLRWVSERRFLHGLNVCMLLPGPEAQQLATYLGWVMHRTWGGLAAGLLFILPGALCILALSLLYAWGAGLGWVQALFWGLQAAVLALVAEAIVRVARKVLKNGTMLVIAITAFVALAALHLPFPLVVLGAGLVGLVGGRFAPQRFAVLVARDAEAAEPALVDRLIAAGGLTHLRPSLARSAATLVLWLAIWLLPLAGLWWWLGGEHLLVRLAVFFSQAAVVTFGGAYAVLAWVAQAVSANGWVAPGDMLAGLGLAETTPGPLILVLQFVGFLAAWNHPADWAPWLAGCAGAAVALWFTFAPCFLWILVGAPFIERIREVRVLAAALAAITAAVVGVIASLALWFAVHVLFAQQHGVAAFGLAWQVPVWSSLDVAALLIAVAAGVALLRFHIALGWVLAAATAVGVVWRLVG
jgi:chromate transporter